MKEIIGSFNNRDLALLTWIAVIVLAIFAIKSIRKHAIELLKICLSSTFILLFEILLCYVLLIIFYSIKLGFWNLNLLKDTVYWFIGVGVIITFKSIRENTQYFTKTIKDSIMLTIVLAFISNLHVFNYWAELISIPVLAFTGIMLAYNEYKTKDKRIESFLNRIISLYSLTAFGYAIYKTIINWKLDFSINNLQLLVLPSILTIALIPLAYLVSVFSAYETMFTRLYNVKNEKYSKRHIKLRLILNGKLNLSKIRCISLKLQPYYLNETKNIRLYLKELETQPPTKAPLTQPTSIKSL